ncbi:hypothetical protein [Propionivibrio sp.]|uniref:hypothetical protein n=1 Tax=Propionivibrio sp. TaxID=2212460 RepID=UPI00345B2685
MSGSLAGKRVRFYSTVDLVKCWNGEARGKAGRIALSFYGWIWSFSMNWATSRLARPVALAVSSAVQLYEHTSVITTNLSFSSGPAVWQPR